MPNSGSPCRWVSIPQITGRWRRWPRRSWPMWPTPCVSAPPTSARMRPRGCRGSTRNARDPSPSGRWPRWRRPNTRAPDGAVAQRTRRHHRAPRRPCRPAPAGSDHHLSGVLRARGRCSASRAVADAASLPGLDRADASVLIRRLLREAVVVPADRRDPSSRRAEDDRHQTAAVQRPVAGPQRPAVRHCIGRIVVGAARIVGRVGRSAFLDSPGIVEPALGRAIARRFETAGMRIAAIRRPGRRSASPRWRWFIAQSGEGSEALHHGEVTWPSDYLDVALDGSDGDVSTARLSRSVRTASTTSVARFGAVPRPRRSLPAIPN